MKSAGKARNNGLYRHIRTSKEIIGNLLNDYNKKYGKYYDPERNALVYETRAAASLNQAQKAKMERMLSQKIGCHPLAAVESNSLIHTKDI